MTLHQIAEPQIDGSSSRTPAQAAVLAQQIRIALEVGYRHSALKGHMRQAAAADASIIIGTGPADTPRIGVRSGDHYYLENGSIWLHASAVAKEVATPICPRALESLVERRNAELVTPLLWVGVATVWTLGFSCLLSDANDWAVAFGVLAIALQRHVHHIAHSLPPRGASAA